MPDEMKVESWSAFSSFPLTLDAVRRIYPDAGYLVRWNKHDALIKMRVASVRCRVFVIEGRVKYTYDDGRSVSLGPGQTTALPSGEHDEEVISVVSLEFIKVWAWDEMRLQKGT